jgi:DNA invertase Pin-like site-specific DNA recombinase
LNILESLKAHRTDFISIRQQIDTSSPTGQLIFNIFACLASYERTQVLERTALGRERAKAHGVKFGRPTKMNSSVAEAVRLLREKGAGIKEIAMSLQIGVGSVYQTLRTAKTAA